MDHGIFYKSVFFFSKNKHGSLLFYAIVSLQMSSNIDIYCHYDITIYNNLA